MSREVLVVSTGTANLASVRAALERAGARPSPATSAAEVAQAPYVVLPGVGAFGPAVERLRADGLVEALRERLLAGRPTLAVCLGLQLLAEASQESPGAVGLGVVPARVGRFAGGGRLRVPQMGWNQVTAPADARYLESGHAYFANSYRLTATPPGWRVASAEHGERFAAALERGGVLACQFHPELSGAWGAALLARWLERAPEEVPSCSACA